MKRKEHIEDVNVMENGFEQAVPETKPGFWKTKKGKATAVVGATGLATVVTVGLKKLKQRSGFAEHDGITDDWSDSESTFEPDTTSSEE